MSDSDSRREADARTRLRDIAAQAHVSLATASKVLNGRPGVSDATRERILELLEQNGYVRRKTDAATASRLLEVLCFELDSPFGSTMVTHLERECAARRVGMVVAAADPAHRPPVGWVEAVVARRPIGVVLVAAGVSASDLLRLRRAALPIVLIDPFGQPEASLATIGSADWSGAFHATSHLIELGHREIGIITGPPRMMASVARLSGYRAALAAAGIESRPDLVRPGSFSFDDGMQQGTHLLAAAAPPSAIFASSDFQALGVYQAARDLGISIPDDLSVVGYDDLPIARWAYPALTTVRVPLADMAARACEAVDRLSADPSLELSRIDVATSVVIRASTAPRETF